MAFEEAAETASGKNFLLKCLQQSTLDPDLHVDIAEAFSMCGLDALSLVTQNWNVKDTAQKLYLTEDEAEVILRVCRSECAKLGLLEDNNDCLVAVEIGENSNRKLPETGSTFSPKDSAVSDDGRVAIEALKDQSERLLEGWEDNQSDGGSQLATQTSGGGGNSPSITPSAAGRLQITKTRSIESAKTNATAPSVPVSSLVVKTDSGRALYSLAEAIARSPPHQDPPMWPPLPAPGASTSRGPAAQVPMAAESSTAHSTAHESNNGEDVTSPPAARALVPRIENSSTPYAPPTPSNDMADKRTSRPESSNSSILKAPKSTKGPSSPRTTASKGTRTPTKTPPSRLPRPPSTGPSSGKQPPSPGCQLSAKPTQLSAKPCPGQATEASAGGNTGSDRAFKETCGDKKTQAESSISPLALSTKDSQEHSKAAEGAVKDHVIASESTSGDHKEPSESRGSTANVPRPPSALPRVATLKVKSTAQDVSEKPSSPTADKPITTKQLSSGRRASGSGITSSTAVIQDKEKRRYSLGSVVPKTKTSPATKESPIQEEGGCTSKPGHEALVQKAIGGVHNKNIPKRPASAQCSPHEEGLPPLIAERSEVAIPNYLRATAASQARKNEVECSLRGLPPSTTQSVDLGKLAKEESFVRKIRNPYAHVKSNLMKPTRASQGWVKETVAGQEGASDPPSHKGSLASRSAPPSRASSKKAVHPKVTIPPPAKSTSRLHMKGEYTPNITEHADPDHHQDLILPSVDAEGSNSLTEKQPEDHAGNVGDAFHVAALSKVGHAEGGELATEPPQYQDDTPAGALQHITTAVLPDEDYPPAVIEASVQILNESFNMNDAKVVSDPGPLILAEGSVGPAQDVTRPQQEG